LIFFSVHASTRRVHALRTNSSLPENVKPQNTRDMYLLKHMIFIFVVYLIGWTPIYIIPVLKLSEGITTWLDQFLQILPAISSMVIIMDLFFYNHEVRQYLKERLLKCLQLNRN
jgi:hypothetical protein